MYNDGYVFQREGFQAEFVHDGLEGLNRFKQEEDWDLLILDVMLPSMDGLTICQKVRQISDVPIIMLTAKETESDQVLGFDLGADDYVTKPFSPLTLMARIKAVKRRFAQTTSTQEGAKEDERLETEHFQLDKNERSVSRGETDRKFNAKGIRSTVLFYTASSASIFTRTIA